MKTVLICLLFIPKVIFSQNKFVEKCIGDWSGTMFIHKNGKIIDSVKVNLSISKTEKMNAWRWKTDYLSEKLPLTKDYTLREKDSANGVYYTDEGNNVLLEEYIFDNKMYSIFEVEGVLLTSTFELRNDNELVFEVTSGKKSESNPSVISNYKIGNLQRVRFFRIKK